MGGTDKGAGPQNKQKKNSRKEHPTAVGGTLVRPAIGRELGISTYAGCSGHHHCAVCVPHFSLPAVENAGSMTAPGEPLFLVIVLGTV